MTRDKLLNYLQRSGFHVFICGWNDFLDLLKIVDSNVLVSVGLEHLSGNLFALKAVSMNEMTVLSTCAAVWTVVVSTGNCAKVRRLDQSVLGDSLLLSCHLLELGHLSFSVLVVLLVAIDRFVCKANKHLWSLAWRLFEQRHDTFSLLYRQNRVSNK